MERQLDPARLGDHLDRLYRAAWALSGSREEAEDLVQETYARVLARPRFLRNEDDLGYLLRALRNTFLTQKRTESRRLRPGPLSDQLDLVADPHARTPQAALEAGELYAAIAALPKDFRDVLVAVDVTGLSYKETARALRIRVGTVMSRLYRARQQVVRRIEGDSAYSSGIDVGSRSPLLRQETSSSREEIDGEAVCDSAAWWLGHAGGASGCGGALEAGR